MYKALRNTHLLTGLFFCLFVLVYGVSSIRFAHNSWVSIEPTRTETLLSADGNEATSPRALARELMDHHGLRGVLHDIRDTEEGFQFRIARIGTLHEVAYNRNKREVRVRTSAWKLMGILLQMHVRANMSTDYWLTNAWGWLAVLTCMALLTLGLTGIYLWFKIHSERFIGSLLLFASLGYGLTLIVLLRTV
jgi:hypothetical protein